MKNTATIILAIMLGATLAQGLLAPLPVHAGNDARIVFYVA